MLFYELIQIALGLRNSLSYSPSEQEWETMFETAQKQAVAGIVFSAIEKQSDNGAKPPISLLYEWFGLSEQIKAQNKLVNKRCCEVTQLFAEAGFKTCILKGQGNALMYPIPETRTSGDIDIWVDGSREKIKNYVRGRYPDAEDSKLHIEFPIFDDVPVEVHYKPSYKDSPKYERRLQEYFSSHAEEQFSNVVNIGNADGQISVPTARFNAVQQMAHMMGHMFEEGIGIRHFIDYFYVLKKLKEEKCTEDFDKLFKYLGLLSFACGTMWIEHEVLGLDTENLIVSEDEKIGRVILKEIEEGGNFGHYDQRYAARSNGYLMRGLTDTYRLIKLVRYFPNDALWKIARKVENQWWKLK